MFIYWQKSGGEEAWQPALADSRKQIIDTEQPRFITVLSVSMLIDSSVTAAEIAQAKYSGPLYFDFDSPDIEVAISKFKQFLEKLKGLGVDLHSLHLYATGGRGFHILVPSAIFCQKAQKGGTPNLPVIYKEMAHELYVDTLDMRVYSARRGRMFRVENSLRENGAYKVPITVEEAFNMTEENYKVLCAKPRRPHSVQAPVLNQRLAIMYEQASQKVASAVKKKKDGSKDKELLARFRGLYPPTLAKVMAGQGSAEDIGFHKIALQIGITTNALGKSEADMLAACEGLIQNHQSDGARYNTPAKRRAELIRMYQYTHDNVCYTYSRDAVRSLAPAGATTADLDGLTDSAGEVLGETDDDEDGYIGGVVVTEGGVYRKTEEGTTKICPLSFRDVQQLREPFGSRKLIGFDLELLFDGKPHGRVLMDNSTFVSRANFQKFASQYCGGTTGTDNNIIALQKLLHRMAMANNGMTYRLSREGLDLVQRPDVNERVWDMVWVTPGQDVMTDSSVHYKYRGNPMAEGRFKSDIMDAPDLEATEETAKVIDALMRVNSTKVVAKLLGWMVAAHHRQIYHKLYKQFPLLHLYGQAGSGKTKTIEAFLPLFYYLSSPIMCDASEDTPWSIQATLLSSASIPVVIDEYKPIEMRPGRHEMYKAKFRACYTSATFGKGGMSDSPGGTWKDITELTLGAPVVVIGEAVESETAFVERTIIAAMRRSAMAKGKPFYTFVRENPGPVSSLGRDILKATFQINLAQFKAKVDANVAEAEEATTNKDGYRQIFNRAVILTGLDFLGELLAVRFGDRFKERLAELRATVTVEEVGLEVTAQPEAAKVLNTLALISTTEDFGSEFALTHGTDYYYLTPDTIDLKMRNVYVKYVGWSKRKGLPVLYATEAAFINGLRNYNACVNPICLDNDVLKVEGTEVVFRFSIAELKKDGVDSFQMSKRK
jgi:hypothetical protein